jgi:hypothetical protein
MTKETTEANLAFINTSSVVNNQAYAIDLLAFDLHMPTMFGEGGRFSS